MRHRRRLLHPVGALLAGPVTVALVATPAGAHTGLPARGLVDGLVHPVLGADHLAAMVAVGVLVGAVGLGLLTGIV